MSHLHVVTSFFNPRRFRARGRLYRDFERYVHQSGAVLHTVEMAFGHRPFEVTKPGTLDQLQFRTHSELWHKERLLNLLIAQVAEQQPDAKYFAWIDADVTFSNPNWVQETIEYLQHYHVIQMFDSCHNLSPDHRIMNSQEGSVAGWEKNGKISWDCPNENRYGFYYHPGFAWAATRWALDQLGGLFDICIAGSADLHMAAALCGNWQFGFPRELRDTPYGKALQAWARRCDVSIEKNIGHLPGSLFHRWHGRACDRGYDKRWRILIDHHYDPTFDIQNDIDGCLAWSGNNPALQDAIRKSLASRNEDSNDCP